jgi:hypothetical protein
VNIFRIKFGQRIQRIDGRSPDCSLLTGRQSPELLESAPICEMRPDTFVADNPLKGGSSYIFNDRLLTHQFKALCAVEWLQEPVLMQMLDRAAVGVNLAHHIVMTKADKQRGPSLEIRRAPARPREDQSIDAARVLMQPMQQVAFRPRRNIEMKHPDPLIETKWIRLLCEGHWFQRHCR